MTHMTTYGFNKKHYNYFINLLKNNYLKTLTNYIKITIIATKSVANTKGTKCIYNKQLF